MTRVNETDEQAKVEALYDAFAPALYRYAWSLLGGGADPGRATATADRGGQDTREAGGDPVTEAVHDALVAGVLLDGERADPADRGPWLYALTRSACQRRGFAHTCPYTRLATVPTEAPVARMFSRLPASHRELVELNLRHALPTGAVARVLGLDDQICGELSRSAIRRAAEGLEGIDPRPLALGEEDPATTGWRTKVQQVSSALALLRPPGPPPALRALVVRTSTDPALAEERERIAAAMHPLTSDGYPLHRSRLTRPVEEEAAAPVEPAAEPLPRALPGDRLTTRDHPVRTETLTRLPGPDATGDDAGEAGTTRRRWPLPAVSGVATVVVAVALWSWAGAVGGPTAVIGTGPVEEQRSPSREVEAVSTASDGKPAAGPTDRTTQVPGTGTVQETTEQAPAQDRTEPPAAEQDSTGAPEDGGDAAPAPPTPQAPSESPSDEPSDSGQDEGGDGGLPEEDPGGGLLTGLWDFLVGGG